jgi:division/cell wall cluster transcriptional repressor MraZ
VFYGTHIVNIDAKSRVSVPALFRNHILAGAPEFNGISVFPSLKAGDSAYMACNPNYLTTLDTRIREADIDPDEADAIAAAIFPFVEMLAFDNAGRISISQTLKARLGVDKQIAFVGMGSDRFELWHPQTHEAQVAPEGVARGSNAMSVLFDRKAKPKALQQ